MSENAVTVATVEVAVTPAEAFSAFTEEMDCWWVRGPINFHDGGRAFARTLEPWIGGRVLEVYDHSRGDVLELARITAWDPPRSLRWRSSIDDVEIEVVFEAAERRTLVTVRATVALDGADRGGSSWVRVVPTWFSRWCERRDVSPRVVEDISRLALAMRYRRPLAAARWLRDVLDLQPVVPLPDVDDGDGQAAIDHVWIEFRVGNGSLMIFPATDESTAPGAHEPWVYVRHLEAHRSHARDRGAHIVEDVRSPWGLPFYVCTDPEGNRWTIAQARPTM